MRTVSNAAGVLRQLHEFAVHLQDALRWTRKTIADLSRDAGLITHCPCCRSNHLAKERNGGGPNGKPLVDPLTFTARWGKKVCFLGNTLPFRLLERLAGRPNQLFRYDILLQDVWDCMRSKEAVRSVVKVLRQKLRSAGMADLAAAIDGSTANHYGLMLDGYSGPHPTDFTQFSTSVSHSTMPK